MKLQQSIFSLLFIALTFYVNASEEKDFFLITLPKSGTHLMTKLLTMMTDREPQPISSRFPSRAQLTDQKFAQAMQECKNQNRFMFGHTNTRGHTDYFTRFGKANPNYVQILQIRDLRDLFVSYVYYKEKDIKRDLGGDPTFNEMLKALLRNDGSRHAAAIEDFVKIGINWYNRPHVFVTRFEDLVGAAGGGNDQNQYQSISSLSKKLNLKLSSKEIKKIAKDLFGDTPIKTFRKGQIGSWKDHFTEEDIMLFKEHWGIYQRALGYSLD